MNRKGSYNCDSRGDGEIPEEDGESYRGRHAEETESSCKSGREKETEGKVEEGYPRNGLPGAAFHRPEV